MRRSNFIILLLCLPIAALSQNDTTKKNDVRPDAVEMKDIKEDVGEPDMVGLSDEDQVYVYAELMPKFPGGHDSLLKFIHNNLVMPAMAIENDIAGRVVVAFIVDKDGKVRDAEVIKKLGWGCEQEALAVVKRMPPWSPGKQNGRAVAVKFLLPFKFSLNDTLNPIILASADIMPSFPGGAEKQKSFIGKNQKYPEAAKKANVKGEVVVEMFVDTAGNIRDPRIAKSLCPECDAESLRVVKLMPKLTPATHKGKKVSVRHTVSFLYGN